MRISIESLEQIANEFTSFEVGTSYRLGSLSLRFGYWRKVDIEKLKRILPKDITVEENLVDEDDECGGELWNYIISPSSYTKLRGVA
tara:strand:+ start:408 stop:668 length:261 start_codon:yes stop_codon:yes gene_type:complete